MRRQYKLNPCDYLFFAHDAMMRKAGQTGNLPFMVMDLAGGLDPAALEAAVDRALQAHPAVRSRAAISLLTGWPRWKVARESDHRPVVLHDLRSCPDWRAEAQSRFESALRDGWDLYSAPQVRLDVCLGPDDQARLCVRWPHALMDAEGVLWFLHEIDRLWHDASDSTSALVRPDHEVINVLAGDSFPQRLRLFYRGLRAYRGYGQLTLGGFSDGPASGGQWRYLHRRWEGAAWRELRDRSLRWCPNGSARFSRYLGGCVLRALHAMFAERGVRNDACLVTLPMRVRDLPLRRPVPGNYLVSATLCATSEAACDKQRLLDELDLQISDYLDNGTDRANWAMVWVVGFLRLGQYRWTLGSRAGLQTYASGFSYYGEIDPPIRSFLGATVTNLWGSGSVSAPPGWNAVFSRFGDSLNLGLSWLDGYYRRDAAERYLKLIESEMFDTGGE
ncbi:MAG: hypothetical protein V3T70_08740 [Phycisphaerae bacterium]